MIDPNSNPCPKCHWPRKPWLCKCIAPPAGSGSENTPVETRQTDELDIEKAKQSHEITDQDELNVYALRDSDKAEVIEEIMGIEEFAAILEKLSEILKVKDEHDKGVLTIEGNWGLSKEQDQELKEFLNILKFRFKGFKDDSKDKGKNYTFDHDESKNTLRLSIPNTAAYDNFTQKIMPGYFKTFLEKLINKGLLHSHRAVQDHHHAEVVKKRKPYDPKPPTDTNLTR